MKILRQMIASVSACTVRHKMSTIHSTNAFGKKFQRKHSSVNKLYRSVWHQQQCILMMVREGCWIYLENAVLNLDILQFCEVWCFASSPYQYEMEYIFQKTMKEIMSPT